MIPDGNMHEMGETNVTQRDRRLDASVRRWPKVPWIFAPTLLAENIRRRAFDLGHPVGQKHEKTGAVQWLADRSGVSKAGISRLIAGKQVEPSVSTIARLAYALDTTVDELIGLPPRGNRSPLLDA